MNRMLLVAFGLLASVAVGQKMAGTFRPPAVPLIAHDPYFSIWSAADRLTDRWPTHWTGKNHSLAGLVRIDGQTWRLLGIQPADVHPLPQTGLAVLPTRTVATFEGPGVGLELTFLAPALPDDLDALGRPVTTVIWQAVSTDGRPHDVAVYLDLTGEVAVNTPDQVVAWGREAVPGLVALRIGSKDQPILEKKGDDLRIDWGHAYLAAPERDRPQASAGEAIPRRAAFAKGEALPADDPGPPRPASDRWPSLALTLDLGRVAAAPVQRHVLVAYDDLWSIQYFDEALRPWWRRGGAGPSALLVQAERDLPALAKRCAAFDAELLADLTAAGGAEYAEIAVLAYRQCLAANKLCADRNGRPVFFPKENFSNGCIATVDVIYPMAPLFLLFGADLAKAMLVPVLDYGASPRWTFPFAPHDLGTYPHATGQVYGGGERTAENQMPVEESANLLLLVAAVAQAEGRADFAATYWPALVRWAEYLRVKGLDPENQLCTDDFAGHLAHNVNLSAKAILALGAFGKLCARRGLEDEAAAWRKTAEDFATRWAAMADDGDHLRLAFDRPGTWSQKYNLVWDRVLGLGLFPDEIKRREVAFYRKVQKPFGLPLDSRKDYTKLDWTTWSACLSGSGEDFAALVAPVRRFLHESPDRVPMGDWYWATNGSIVNMIARPVVGGVFMRLLHEPEVWKKWFARGASTADPWAALPLIPFRVLAPTAEDGPVSWRYTVEDPGPGWEQPEFDDRAWNEGPAGFGTHGTPGAVVRTEWGTKAIWLRRAFDLAHGNVRAARLRVHHDEDVEVWINGVLAYRGAGWFTAYQNVFASETALATLKPGANTIAVRCRQTAGGQYVDVGLVVPEREPAGPR